MLANFGDLVLVLWFLHQADKPVIGGNYRLCKLGNLYNVVQFCTTKGIFRILFAQSVKSSSDIDYIFAIYFFNLSNILLGEVTMNFWSFVYSWYLSVHLGWLPSWLSVTLWLKQFILSYIKSNLGLFRICMPIICLGDVPGRRPVLETGGSSGPGSF